jgi:hypothetical protein
MGKTVEDLSNGLIIAITANRYVYENCLHENTHASQFITQPGKL